MCYFTTEKFENTDKVGNRINTIHNLPILLKPEY